MKRFFYCLIKAIGHQLGRLIGFQITKFELNLISIFKLLLTAVFKKIIKTKVLLKLSMRCKDNKIQVKQFRANALLF